LVGEFAAHRHSLFLQFTLCKLEDLADETVDIDRSDLPMILLEYGSDSVEYLTCPVAVLGNAFENLPDLIEIRR
jgi:hypothetical protein